MTIGSLSRNKIFLSAQTALICNLFSRYLLIIVKDRPISQKLEPIQQKRPLLESAHLICPKIVEISSAKRKNIFLLGCVKISKLPWFKKQTKNNRTPIENCHLAILTVSYLDVATTISAPYFSTNYFL